MNISDGSYIWSANLKSAVYFRKTFQMPETTGKTLLISDGDKYTIFLNGKLVRSVENISAIYSGLPAGEAKIIDISQDLKTGQNIIAVRAVNRKWSDAGFFACVCTYSPEGYQVLLVTDRSWKYSEQSQEDWNSFDFDDSNWSYSSKVRDFFRNFAITRSFPDLGRTLAADIPNLVLPKIEGAQTMQLSNERLSLILEYTDRKCTFYVKDNLTQEVWFMPGPPFKISDSISAWDGSVRCVKTQDGIRVTTTNFSSYPDLTITYTLSIKANLLEMTLEPIKGFHTKKIVKVAFPLHFGAVQGKNEGCLVNSFHRSGGRMFPFQLYDKYGFQQKLELTLEPEMPFFGIVRGSHPCAAILVDSSLYEYQLQTLVNSDRDGLKHLYSITPIWFFEEGRMNEPRRISYQFLERGGYTEIAKTYRQFLIDTGRYATLRERVKRRPVCNLIADATFFWGEYPLDKMPKFMTKLKAKGIEKAVLQVANRNDFVGGWKRWPEGMSSLYNTTEEFKQTANLAREMGYGFSPVDEFMTFADRGECYDERLRAMQRGGGYYYFDLEKCFYLCESQKLQFAKEEMPRVKEIIGECPYLLDTEGCNLYECFHPEHPMTFTQAIAARRKFLKYVKEIFGCVVAEGSPWDCLTDIVDVGHAFFINFDYWGENKPGTAIPLWSLVYNGAVIVLMMEQSHRDAMLYAILYGLNPRFGFNLAGNEINWHKKITAAWTDRNFYELVNHEFITPLVQKSKFQEGNKVVEVIANFGDAEYRYDSQTIPPHNFIIKTNF